MNKEERAICDKAYKATREATSQYNLQTEIGFALFFCLKYATLDGELHKASVVATLTTLNLITMSIATTYKELGDTAEWPTFQRVLLEHIVTHGKLAFDTKEGVRLT